MEELITVELMTVNGVLKSVGRELKVELILKWVMVK